MQVYIVDGSAAPPQRHSDDAAGYDLRSAEETVLDGKAITQCLVDTGVHVAIPRGHFGLVKSRSSMALRGVEVGAGVIDSDYRGPIRVKLFTTKALEEPILIKRGDRIAQLIIIPCASPTIRRVSNVADLGHTGRGAGGFGSTGDV